MGFGLLGEKLSHSYSPAIHRQLGNYAYALFSVAPADLEDFLLHGDFEGLNVTIPYKKAVLPYCAALSDTARRIGSVNTLIRRRDGSLFGDNTDYDGFSWLLERNGGIRSGEKALILGSGGASVTVQAVLQEQGAQTVVISRTGENNYVNLYAHQDAVLLVNTTPVGMYPDNGSSPVCLSRLPHLRCVLDLIYNPGKTALLLEAEALGLLWENGLSMLVGQAKRAAELFGQKRIPNYRCDEVLCKLRRETENLILIGMPGCGKSTVGQLLGSLLQRPFLDSDRVLEEKLGCSIPEFFSRHGEDAFRAAETEVLAELGKRSGCVIATGGGCVTRAENYPLLHQNGLLFWLDRDLTALPKEGRPISQSCDLNRLYAQRKPLYEAFCDCGPLTGESPRAVAEEILALLRGI